MKIGIVGSRGFDSYELVKQTMNEYVETVDTIVSGGAKGADSLGEKWAKEYGKKTLIYKPEWDKYGKRAGFIRNEDIVKNSDFVLAFWDGKSRGTKSSIDLCEKYKIPVKIINYKMDLNKVAQEIRDIISQRQKELGLSFEEERHLYTMNGRSDWPSVSKVLKKFYKEFPTEEAAYNKAGGDPERQQQLIEEWAAAGLYSTNMGSRVHFVLEKELISRNGDYKEVRQPIFDCDLSQLMKSDSMIVAGKRYLDLMEQRNVVLLDTEMVLGDPELAYVGQPDKVWLTLNKEGNEFGLLITDYKTNKPKNFLENSYTERMYPPFERYPNNALGHYYVQLPLYGKLLLKMLQGSKYENVQLYGCIITHLRDDTQFEEFRVPKGIIDTVLSMDMRKYLDK